MYFFSTLRSLALPCLLSLCALSCGDSEEDTSGTQTTSTNTTSSSSSTSSSSTTTETSSTTTETSSTSSTTATSSTSSTTSSTTTSPNPDPRFVQLIRSDPFPRLSLELDYVSGTAPSDTVRDNIANLFTDLLDKPSGVVWSDDEVIASRGSDYAWTNEDLDTLALGFNQPTPDDTISIQVIFLDGHFAGDEGNRRILGLAWNYTHLVMFHDTIRDLCERSAPPLANQEDFCNAALTSVMTHEIGHLIGLVDNGLPMIEDHRDPDHGRHDSNEDCIMYWAFEGPQMFDSLASLFLGGSTEGPSFDDQCLQDIAAIRDAP